MFFSIELITVNTWSLSLESKQKAKAMLVEMNNEFKSVLSQIDVNKMRMYMRRV